MLLSWVPVADARSSRNSREVSELLTHYSRQIMGEITTVVFERLQYIQPGSPAADEVAAAAGVLPHISSVVAAAAAEAAAVKAAAAAEAAAAEAAAAEAAAAAAAAAGVEQQAAGVVAAAGVGADGVVLSTVPGGAQVPAAAGSDAAIQQQQQQPPGPPNVLTLATGPIQTAGSLSDTRSPGVAAALAAAAAAAAASSGGAAVAGARPAAAEQDDDAVSDAGATVASSTVAFADAVSVVDSLAPAGDGRHASAAGALVGVPGSLTALNTGYPGGSTMYSHGLPCAVEVLNFLIDCIAQRRTDGEGSSTSPLLSGPPDDEYAMFGLSMVHRAVLAGGAMLQTHDALLSLLHKDLFAAMVVAVSTHAAARGQHVLVCASVVWAQRRAFKAQASRVQHTACMKLAAVCVSLCIKLRTILCLIHVVAEHLCAVLLVSWFRAVACSPRVRPWA